LDQSDAGEASVADSALFQHAPSTLLVMEETLRLLAVQGCSMVEQNVRFSVCEDIPRSWAKKRGVPQNLS